MTELVALFSILKVDRAAACVMAGVGIRSARRYWSGENSPSIDTLGRIRKACIQIADQGGKVTRATKKRIRCEIGPHMLDIVDEFLA
jgi:hypothetical protein